ncbi:RNA pyrophosphohydrolase [Candidatus Jidaibacter acanthamoeba]|uniref:RNA pyrophosphohydrolase n=1 Tax=Candidatus Jidaibacter acanthamoebae TaxID=86105 RepID=A0A0C1MWQ7_9RICK|nr:RNA pyrophosphohydrolase [Candidatus Jidaibacter acanthamoeba]KIE04336.1 RNA pyrophosphohydrolase [Candidatus Jidaibacter acanthamoeba]
MEKNSTFRYGVGIMLINNENKVFVGQRVKESSEAWQMPQGGIDEGENPDQALMREVLEEIGTDNIEIIAGSSDWYQYNIPEQFIPLWWGGKYIGQKQKWYLAKFLGNDSEININTEIPEFINWKWVDVEELPELIVSFKKKLYQDLVEEFKPIIDKLSGS